MPNCSRKHIKRFTPAVYQRNANLIRCIDYIDDNGPTCSEDLGAYLNFKSASTGRAIVKELLSFKLIKFSHYEGESNRTKGVAFYTTTEGAESRARDVFPVIEAESVVQTRGRRALPAQRDPLHAYLMGFGRAPSLNFMNSP